MILVAIDPGRHTGIAVFIDGRLAAASALNVDPLKPPNLGIAADEVIVEVPTIYPRSPVDPASLIKLAFTAGVLVGRLGAPKVRAVAPREWKGQRPKAIHNKRTLSLLDANERAKILRATSDVLDAIGLGLWAVGRA